MGENRVISEERYIFRSVLCQTGRNDNTQDPVPGFEHRNRIDRKSRSVAKPGLKRAISSKLKYFDIVRLLDSRSKSGILTLVLNVQKFRET